MVGSSERRIWTCAPRNSGQADLRRNHVLRRLPGGREVEYWVARKTKGARCAYLVGSPHNGWDGIAFFLNDQDVRHWGILHECGWLALLMLISNAYLHEFPRRAVSRSAPPE